MKNLNNLLILLIILILGSIVVIIAGYLIITNYELTSEQSVPILAGIAGFVGITVTTFYKEISSRYEEKRARAQKRWELVFPMLKESYIPWKNSAKKLSESLIIPPDGFTDSGVNSVMYHICLFYGLRMEFIIKHGGSILLGTRKDEEAVENAYDEIKNSFNWAGTPTSTHRCNSELKQYFVKYNPKDDPLVFYKFEEFLKSDKKFGPSIATLKAWLNSDDTDSIKRAKEDIDKFTKVFEESIATFSGREG